MRVVLRMFAVVVGLGAQVLDSVAAFTLEDDRCAFTLEAGRS